MRQSVATYRQHGLKFHIFRALLFTVVATVIWGLINIDHLREYMDTYQKREQEREEIEQLSQRIRKLKRQQQSLAYNGVESEKQIRERLGLQLPGEQVLFLKHESTPASETVTSASTSSAKLLTPNASVTGGTTSPNRNSKKEN